MIIHPAVIVHGLSDARKAVAPGLPVTLLSAPGAALYAGCLWWREVAARAREGSARPDTVMDILDCADAPGLAMGAVRSGVHRLVLWPGAAGWEAVAAVAEREGGFVLAEAPAALDMAGRNAIRHLPGWLGRAEGAGHAGSRADG